MAITIDANEPYPPYRSGTCPLDSLEIVGPGQSEGTVTGVKFEHQGSAENGAVHHLAPRNCNITGFARAVAYGHNTYNITWLNLTAYQNRIAIHVPADAGSNYGERLAFIGCTFFNNALDIYCRSSSTGLHFTNVSFDYSATAIDAADCRVFLTDCHIENHSWEVAPFIKLGGSEYSTFRMSGGLLILNGDTPVRSRMMPCIIEVSGSSQALFDGVFMNNLAVASGVFAMGPGLVRVRNTQSPLTTPGMPHVQSSSRSLLPSSSASTEGSTEVLDPWWVIASAVAEGDTPQISSRLAGDHISISTTAQHYRSGTRSVEVNKTGAHTIGRVALLVPVEPDGSVTWLLWYSAKGGAGRAYLSASWVCNLEFKAPPAFTQLGPPVLARQILKTDGVDIPWTAFHNDAPIRRAPAGATHLAMTLTCDEMQGKIYFADLNVSQW